MIIIIIGKSFFSSSGNTLSKENTLPTLAGYKLAKQNTVVQAAWVSHLKISDSKWNGKTIR